MPDDKKKSLQDIYQEKSTRLMEGVAAWCAYYRENPSKFAVDYLNITNLKPFQKINLYEFMHNINNMFWAGRGIGKTHLLALYAVIRCILYPGTVICVASFRKEQSREIITRIMNDFMKLHGWGSVNLCSEIDDYSDSVNYPHIGFKNGSLIHTVVANDSSRHNRANILIIDEVVLVDHSVINTVLKNFLTSPRAPRYLEKPEYAHLKERNSILMASSCSTKSNWTYDELKSYFVNMLDENKKYFCCGIPYQLAIKEGLQFREDYEDKMSEASFDEISFLMESGCLFYSDSDGSFFTYQSISDRRKIKYSLYPLEIYRALNIKPPPLQHNERRILSVDVALMKSRKKQNNDASALIINSAIPTESSNEYISNIVYIESNEGLTTDQLGILVMRLFYQFECTDLVLDTAGQGLGVFDYIIKNQYDDEYQTTYDALNCVNDSVMADRCKVKNAKKVVWSIKASPQFNSDIAFGLRAGFQNNKINLLITENDADDVLPKIKGYNKLSQNDRHMLKLPYIQTSLLINEIVNLDYTQNGTMVKVKERSGNRKDRYSSLAYSYKIASDISIKEQKPTIDKGQLINYAYFKKPKIGAFGR